MLPLRESFGGVQVRFVFRAQIKLCTRVETKALSVVEKHVNCIAHETARMRNISDSRFAVLLLRSLLHTHGRRIWTHTCALSPTGDPLNVLPFPALLCTGASRNEKL